MDYSKQVNILVDYIKNGDSLNIKEHILLDTLNKKRESTTGLICIADLGCPFCKKATRERLNIIKERLPASNIYITLNSDNQTHIDQYISDTNAENIQFLKFKGSRAILELAKGRFPSFILVSDGKIIKRWGNAQMGFPALDVIESYLK